ncbi:leucine-rich repeat-containing protein 2mit [Haematobia irritans]|uniref:leucine-rich repeat-containing protein 2mit n=1 Tax=Haematobia irritans TaxID=7368 RepID=UPI003F50C8AA
MSFKCQILRKRLTFFHNVLELSCDVRIIILCCLIAILPTNIKCAKLQNPQIRLLINDDDLLHEKTSRHEAAAAAAAAAANVPDNNSGEHFNLYRSELKRLSYETIHRILRDENEPSYRREETELRYYQKRSPTAYEESHQLNKRSTTDSAASLALDYSKRNLREFPITPQLAKELAAASSLDLSDNHLTHLNVSLISNDHLHSLNLSNNSFSHIPLTQKSSLKSLNLNFNKICSSSLEPNIYLRNLYISNNHIENLMTLNLSLLKNLEVLDMSCNRLQSLETSLFPERMHNLKHLNLAHNQLGSIYRESFYNLLSLNTLLLAHNTITDIDYETFLALPNLQYLDLSFNRLRGKSIRALQGITGLVALNIAHNPELGPFMQEFVASWSLKELDASGTGLCQIPAALAQSVRSLKLTHNWLKVINCGDLDSYPLLQYLDLSFSHVEEIEDDALGRLEVLEILLLDHNNLKRIPQSLPVALEHLFLQNNGIMDIQAQSFQGLSSLKTLDLSHNKILYLPDVALPKLQTLNLQSAEIRGISQAIVHTLPRLNELFLEDNPIKCSDLLGIAEWASTCRLRTTKEDDSVDNADEEVVGDGGSTRRRELKQRYMKMYNFYEKFGGKENCKGENVSLPQPLCAAKAAQRQQGLQQLEAKQKFKDSRENFNFNSIMAAAIPLPAKKAEKTLTAQQHPETETTVATFGDIAVTAITPNSGVEMSAMQQGILTTPASTMNERSLRKALASSEDKPQKHLAFANEMRTKETFESEVAKDQLSVTGSQIPKTLPTPIYQQQRRHDNAGVKKTSDRSLQNANLPEIFKPKILETIIKTRHDEDNNKQAGSLEHRQYDKGVVADTMTNETTEVAGNSPPTTLPTTPATYASAINFPKPEKAPTMLIIANNKAMTKHPAAQDQLHRQAEHKKIKMKIGPTTEIKSSESTTMAAPTSSWQKFILTSRITTEMPYDTPTMADNSKRSNIPSSPPSLSNKELHHSSTTNSTNDKMIVNNDGSTRRSTTLSNIPHKTEAIEQNEQQPQEPTTTTATLQDLASNNPENNNTNSNKDNSPNPLNKKNNSSMVAHTNGQDNKTLVTLHITTPITPNIVLHSKDMDKKHPSPPKHQDAGSNKQQHPSVPTEATPTSPSPPATLERNDVNDAECMQSNRDGCTSARPQRQDKENVIGPMPNAEKEMTMTAIPTIFTTNPMLLNADSTTKSTTAVEAASASAETTSSTTSTIAAFAAGARALHKHEPLQLHIKDRHLIGTPLLMHKGDNLMVATDELIKANPQDNNAKRQHQQLQQPTTVPATGPQTDVVDEAKNKPRILEKSQTTKTPFPTTSPKIGDLTLPQPQQQHNRQEPYEHKGETLKTKAYTSLPYAKKAHEDEKTKKPSLIMKKMTIVTKQHEITGSSSSSSSTITHSPQESGEFGLNEVHRQQKETHHYQELRPLHGSNEKGGTSSPSPSHLKHSTVNTPITKEAHLVQEPQTFQHEHELLMQQILHDEQQQQHEKASQSEQWSDLRRTTNKENHPGLIVLVSSGLFVVLLLGLMHVYRCDVPWRRNSPAHHLRPHQRHHSSLDDDVHSFLSYSEGMQKWHHSTRQEAPYSSPLHNLHVRELQKTSAIEKPATFKTAASYAATSANCNRNHILPRTNSQSSNTTTRTTSPSSSAILDDETFYIEMTPPVGQFAQALQSELLPMELLNMAPIKSSSEIKESCTDSQTCLEDDYLDYATSSRTHHTTPYKPTTTSTTMSLSGSRNDELLSSTSGGSSSTFNSQKPLYTSRKFGLW